MGVVNRANLDIDGSNRQEITDCKLDQFKDSVCIRPGQAKKRILSLENTTSIFARIADIYKYFEHALLELFEPFFASLPAELDFSDEKLCGYVVILPMGEEVLLISNRQFKDPDDAWEFVINVCITPGALPVTL
jgi:hypothetical protein